MPSKTRTSGVIVPMEYSESEHAPRVGGATAGGSVRDCASVVSAPDSTIAGMERGALILSPDDPVSMELASTDPQLGGLIRRVGRVEIAAPDDPFTELVGSIVAQQLSLKAAGTIWKRVIAAVPPTPEGFSAADPDELRAAGLSRAKTAYVQGIAHTVVTGDLDLSALDTLDDEQVIEQLVRLKGVGRWTAEMFLLFALRRPDVLALDDLGVRGSAGKMADLGRPMTRDELAQRGDLWRPHRSTASLWLWESLA